MRQKTLLTPISTITHLHDYLILALIHLEMQFEISIIKAQPNLEDLNVLMGEAGWKCTKTEIATLWNDFLDLFIRIHDKLQVARPHTILYFYWFKYK